MSMHSHNTGPSRPSWVSRNARRVWPFVPLLGILAALAVSDLDDVIGYKPFDSNQCTFSDTEQSSRSAKMYMPIARWALRYTPTPRVAIIYIDPASDPPELLTNVCASRGFLSRLIPALNSAGAETIVIDKYYTAGACAEPMRNAAFIAAMESSKIPIVVGQSTHAISQGAASSGCMALSSRLEFSSNSKVSYGLIRLNTDDLKIPLRWPVFSDASGDPSGTPPAAAQLPTRSGDSLSLVAAKAVDPNVESDPAVQKLLAAQIHPYTTFLDDLPHITGLTALCSLEPSPHAAIDDQPADELCRLWTRPPDDLDGKKLNLAGKIVVIGDLSEQDMKPFPTSLALFPPGKRPGVFLHANYIQSLLDHRFLVEIPRSVTIGCLIAYVLVLYCLYWAHDAEGRARLSPVKAGLCSLVILSGAVLLSLLVLVTTSYFTPVWALWGAGVFTILKYLEATAHHQTQHLTAHLAIHRPAAIHATEPPYVEKGAGDSDLL